MTDRTLTPDEMGRILESWLESEAPVVAPATLNSAVIDVARGARQRPTWLAGLRVTVGRPAGVLGLGMPRRGLQLAFMLLLLALGAALIGVAGHLMHVPAPPLGLARNGLIAFESNGQIAVVNTDGTGHAVLTSSAATKSSPIWSPDGTRLAFWGRSQPDGRLFLTVIDADGGNSRVVTGASSYVVPPTAGDWLGSAEVDWSPDGSRIAFGATVGGTNRIVVATLDGDEPTLVGDPSLAALSPSWSPDGTRIAFAGGRPPDVALYVMNADGSNVKRVSFSPGGAGSFYGVRWSPDGSRLLYAADASTMNHQIWAARADGSGEQLFDSPQFRYTNDIGPTWSPDGQRIAFIRADMGSSVSYLQLFVMNADGSGQVGLPHPAINPLPPRWSPDGSRILAGTVDNSLSAFVLIDSHGVEPPIFISANGWGGNGVSWQRLNP